MKKFSNFINESRGTGFKEHDEAARALKKHATDVDKTDDAEDEPSHIHLGAVSPKKVDKLHDHLINSGFSRSPTATHSYYGTHSGDRGIDKYHHYTKGDTHVLVSHKPNTFGKDERGPTDHHHVEIVTHKAGGNLR